MTENDQLLQHAAQAVKQVQQAVQEAQATADPQHLHFAHMQIETAQQQLSALQDLAGTASESKPELIQAAVQLNQIEKMFQHTQE